MKHHMLFVETILVSWRGSDGEVRGRFTGEVLTT